jgi:hypothetical protein
MDELDRLVRDSASGIG